VPDPAAEYRTTHHCDQRKQPPDHPGRAGLGRAQGVRRRAVRGRAAAAVGRPGRPADRPGHHRVAGPGGPPVSEQQAHGAEVSALLDSGAEADEAAAAGVPADPGLAAERDRLARTLREIRLQLAMTQARLAALEQSATMELGRTLVRAARRPWSRGVQLPADLVRLWRERGALTAPGLGAPVAAAPGWTPPGLVITGVLTAGACATLAPDAAVLPLLPHDADVMLESAGADLVLIE